MTNAAHRFINTLLDQPETLAVVGTGSQAREMRQFIWGKHGLGMEDIPGTSSAEAPLGRSFYLLCATPLADATATLLARGIPSANIVPWVELRAALESVNPSPLRERVGLGPRDSAGRPVRPPSFRPGFDRLLTSCESELRGLLVPEQPWSEDERRLLELLSAVYLQLRGQWATLHPGVEKRLLFPSPGRCGGVSLTDALRKHPRLRLCVDHEGMARAIYWALALHRRQRLSATPLVAIAAVMLDEFDCLGGNPFCFLVPYLRELPWFECHVLKVERPAAELRESIVQRNFHYSPTDFVPERITGAAWGDMSEAAWSALSLEAKVDWYIARVDAEIERGAGGATSITRVPVTDLTAGLNRVLRLMGWPTLPSVPHLNTLPKDCIYSYEERIRLFRQQRPEETPPPRPKPDGSS